jgi:surface protein
MSNLFYKKGKFNVDISSWDTSSVTDMYQMFRVRAPPTRVLLLLLRRCVVVVPLPSLRDHHSLHTAARPSLRCRLPMPSISPSVIGT